MTNESINNIAQVVASINYGLKQICQHVNAPIHTAEFVHALPSGLRFTWKVKTEGNPFKIYDIVECLKSYMADNATGFSLLNSGRITYVNGTGDTFHFWFP
jgi:hypothetical protein